MGRWSSLFRARLITRIDARSSSRCLHWRISQRSLFWTEAFANSRRTEGTLALRYVGLEHALGCNTPAADPPRRCGSTLLRRALPAVGACSLSEPHYLKQFCAPWDPEPGWTLARCVEHRLHVLCVGLLHVRDSKVFILNLKGIAAPLWTVRFWQTPSMWCTSRCIGMLWTCWNHAVPAHLATSRHLGRRICVRRMFLLYRKESVLPTPP